MAYLVKKNGYWYTGYRDHTGKAVKRKTKFAVGLVKDEKAAQREADECEAKADRIRKGLEAAPNAAMTFQAVVDDYLAVHAPTLRSFRDIKQRLLTHIVPVLGPKLITEIEPADIQKLLNKKKAEGFSPQTLQHLPVHISAVYSYAIKHRKACRDNPAKNVPEVFIPPRPPKVIPADVVDLLIRHVPLRWRGLFAVAAYAGLRKGELLGLRVGDVDLANMVITVSHSYEGAPKGGKVRYVPVAPDLVPYLRMELGRVRSPWLFPALSGDMQNRHCHLPRTLRNALKRAGVGVGFDHKCRNKKCDFLERRADNAWSQCPGCGWALVVKAIPPDWSFKDLRSTCATLAYEKTGDIRFVKELIGHADINVTMERYAPMRSAWMATQASKLSYSVSPQELPRNEDQKPQESTEDKNARKVIRL